MFYDLGVRYDGEETAKTAAALRVKFGWDTAAVDLAVGGRVDRPLGKEMVVPDVSRETRGLATAALRLEMGTEGRRAFHVLRRVTVDLSDQGQVHGLNPNNPHLCAFDLVAVRPTTEKLFAQACGSLEVDIIVVDTLQRLPWMLRHGIVQQAIARGVMFELAYGPGLSDSKARKAFFANGMALVRATKGRNIILSAGSSRALDTRGPYDVANLGEVLGMNSQQARAAIDGNCRAALLHSAARRAYRGTLTMQPREAMSEKDAWMLQGDELKGRKQADEARRIVAAVEADKGKDKMDDEAEQDAKAAAPSVVKRPLSGASKKKNKKPRKG